MSKRIQLFPKMYVRRSFLFPPPHPHSSAVSQQPPTDFSHKSNAVSAILFSTVYLSAPKPAATTSSPSQGSPLAPMEILSRESVASINTNNIPPKTEFQRRSLLIYGADRSGTTFTTKMFAEDPQLFTVYEPLWVTSAWNKEGPLQVTRWKRNVLDVLRGILSCKFGDSQAGTRFLNHTQTQWSGAFVKNPFRSATFCGNDTCQDLSKIPNHADKICLSKYKHSVTKIGEPRMPEELLSTVIPDVFLENPETDVRVIQLVRDPRASFNSRIKLGWMEEFHRWHFPVTVREKCSKLVQNIKFGRELPNEWRHKYLEVHYKDLARNPVETTRNMYRFAGFEMPQSIIDWVVRNTSPSKEEILREKANVFSPVRNSSAMVDQWRNEAPIERTRILEKHCKEALDLLGLTKVTK